MALIKRYGFFSRLHSDANQYILRYRKGKLRQSGRGLVFWFRPDNTSVAQIPVDDREMTMFVKGRSSDFQEVNVQGAIGWRAVAPEQLAERIDFTISNRDGFHIGQPLDSIDARMSGVASQAILDYLAHSPVRTLLDDGIDPLRKRVEAALKADPGLTEIGIGIVSVRLANLMPSSELQRALQTPTFEALQQKADEATFERRALAVEKERAIAENELANKVELARREKQLIAEETGNAKSRAQGTAEAQKIETEAQAEQIKVVGAAKAEADKAMLEAYRELPSGVLMGLAARDLAQKLEKIEHLNVTPDTLAAVMREFGSGKSVTGPAGEAE